MTINLNYAKISKSIRKFANVYVISASRHENAHNKN